MRRRLGRLGLSAPFLQCRRLCSAIVCIDETERLQACYGPRPDLI